MSTKKDNKMDSMREAFEVWARSTGYGDRDLERSTHKLGQYAWRETQMAWLAWQAASGGKS